jgi:uncharacterized protein YfkK (UPF0435 family)
MFESELLMSLYSPKFNIAQMPVEIDVPFDHPDIGGLMFLSPQFFVALIAGVIMAFGFQFLLTNFSIAAKISNWDEALPDDDDDSESFGTKIRKTEGLVGGWILVTVNLALFLACFLAVKLTSIASVDGAAIIGIVIWAAYFLTLVWLGSSAVGSMIGSLIKTAFSGVQGVMGTAGAAIGGKMASDQMVNTVEASVAAVRRELSSAVDTESIRETVQDYVGSLQLPKLDVKEIRGQFEKLLGDADIKSLAGSDVLKNVNRQTFVDLISGRTDFSKEEVNQIADQLEGVWKQTFGKQQEQKDPNLELVDFLKFAAPDLLKSDELNAKLSQILESRENKSESSSGMKRAMQLGVEALVGTVLSRTDLSDLDVEKISGQLQQLTAKGTEKAKSLASQVGDKVPALPFNTAKADVENYLLNAQPWHLNRETIKQEFRDVIYDPEASPGAVLRQLELFNPDYFVGILGRREGFAPEQVTEIAEQLEGVRQEVLEIVQAAAGEEQSQDLRSRIENYLRSTGKDELNPEGIERDFQALLDDRDAGFEALRDRLSHFNRDTLVQLLGQREDFSPEEADQLIGRLESSRDRVISQAQELQEQAKSKAQELRQKVEEYLRNTNKEELNPEAIEREFQTLLSDPEAGLKALRERLSQFDRDTLVQLLSQRQDLNEEQINGAIDKIESVRDNIIHAPQIVADKAKEQYEEVTAKIGEYLRNTNLEELDPEGLNRDLTKFLFENPKEGALALRERLSQVDRETLVKLLSQREDLSEEQINRTIDRVQDSIRTIVKSPRRLASRAQKTVKDFQGSLENYLRNTDKEELNPDGIKRDLQLLFNEPGMGMQSLGDRVKHFDRSTLVALLSQREDISEEEANRIADQIESVRNQIVEQIQMVQDKFQSAMDGVFGKIRDYLNSLDRPELNYEGIKRDFRKVFDDPQAGFDAIKERLGEFDRGTLVALLSSRSDISETDAHRIVDQMEGARDSVLLRSERLQSEAKKRIKQLKNKAKQQAEDAREAAATAAWWLFGTALTSVVVSALAGAIAVGGISGLFS